MATPILLPKQGNTVETCSLLRWIKKKGDNVKRGDILCEVETDKAMFEIDSPEDGVLLDLFFNEGDDIPVLTNIAVVGKPGEDYAELLPAKRNASGEVVEAPKAETEQAREKSLTSVSGFSSEQKGISPRAARLAEQSGLSIQKIQGTGPGGRIIERDVLATTASSKLPEVESGRGNRRVISDFTMTGGDDIHVAPLKGVRRLIAERMLASTQTSAQLTLNASANAANLLEVRDNFKNNAKYYEFSSVTINDLVHHAVLHVLPHHPALNSLLQDDKIFSFTSIHLGFAVDTPRGLVVPVIKHAQKLKLLDLSNEAKRLANLCVSGRILPDELNGGTFTVTNLGNFGIESFTPVLNLPQTAILGVDTIAPKPARVGNGIEMMPHISFSLTIDHRVIDGVTGAKFLQELASKIAEISLEVAG
jgi:pyruvate dehydrogenase E2 component (dihydrolipoamide acetyltransferase)